MSKKLTLQQARDYFRYDAINGQLFRVGERRRSKAAGSMSAGYLMTMVDGDKYHVHRIIWLLETGEWPEGRLFFRDRDPWNTRYENLTDRPEVRLSRKALYDQRRAFTADPSPHIHISPLLLSLMGGRRPNTDLTDILGP